MTVESRDVIITFLFVFLIAGLIFLIPAAYSICDETETEKHLRMTNAMCAPLRMVGLSDG